MCVGKPSVCAALTSPANERKWSKKRFCKMKKTFCNKKKSFAKKEKRFSKRGTDFGKRGQNVENIYKQKKIFQKEEYI